MLISYPLIARGCRFILLRGKIPVPRHGRHWVTTDPEEIARHRGNVGIMAGNHAVLDVDDKDAWVQMTAAIGPLQPTVETGSGKIHCYVAHVPGLPRAFFWRGTKVGEIVRLPTEYAVCPPSIHPTTHQPYRWLVDPGEPWATLPEAWRAHLFGESTSHVEQLPNIDRVSFIPAGDTTGADFEDLPAWHGPPPEEMVRRALAQPGAKRRTSGIKFQCPGCRAEGHDRHRDNATVFNDGRWGCALSQEHRRSIGEALGVVATGSIATVEGYDAGVLRRLGLRL